MLARDRKLGVGKCEWSAANLLFGTRFESRMEFLNQRQRFAFSGSLGFEKIPGLVLEMIQARAGRQ